MTGYVPIMWKTLPIIALLTDFGLHDTYVGQMHGVIAGHDASLNVIDVTHGIPAQDVLGGAFALEEAVAAFPAGTIFVAVVDPGVGSQRRAIAAEFGHWRYVGPDNGLLSLLLEREQPQAVVELSNERFHRQPRSSTFHGRDIFAPVAAAWACGTPITEFGPVITNELVHLKSIRPIRQQVGSQVRIQGIVVNRDHFGNLLTNIRRADLGGELSPTWHTVEIAGERIDSVSQCYADVARGAVLTLFGSQDRLEIAVSGGSAVERFPEARTVVVTYNIA